jgi:hypothetical protein
LRALAAAALLTLAGCAASVGPPTIARDRFDYVEAISHISRQAAPVLTVPAR